MGSRHSGLPVRLFGSDSLDHVIWVRVVDFLGSNWVGTWLRFGFGLIISGLWVRVKIDRSSISPSTEKKDLLVCGVCVFAFLLFLPFPSRAL